MIPALPDVHSLRVNGNLSGAWDQLEAALPTITPENAVGFLDLCASVYAWYLIVWYCEPLPADARTYPLWVRYHYAQTRSRPHEILRWPLGALPDVDTQQPEHRLLEESSALNEAVFAGKWALAASTATTILDLADDHADFSWPFFTHARAHTWLQIIPLAARHGANPIILSLIRAILASKFAEFGLHEIARLYAWLFSPDEAWDDNLQAALADAEPYLDYIPAFLRDELPTLASLTPTDEATIHRLDAALPGLALTSRFGAEKRRLAPPAISTSKGADFTFTSVSGASTISGNSHLIKLGSTHLLLDLGLNVNIPITHAYQTIKSNLVKALSADKAEFNDIHALLITHAHTDHIGLLPMLYRDPDLEMVQTSAGSRPKIHLIANDPTREIAAVMLRDTANIHRETANPPFGEADVVGVLRALDPFPADGQLDPFRDRGRIETHHAGHILGSQMLLLEHGDTRIMFTGDINTIQQATVDPVKCPHGSIDVLIMEHTYGSDAGRMQFSRAEQESAFIDSIDRVLRRGGSIVVPCFAVGRAQEILCLLSEHAQAHPDLYYDVYLDGLARSITSAYDYHITETTARYRSARDWLDRRLIVVSTDTERTETLTSIKTRPSVIVASSGMLKTGSASHFYATALADDARNAIFLTGYMAEDSEASLILSGNKQEALDRLGMNVRCEVRHFHFTAHAPRLGLLNFVHQIEPRSIILVHGMADQNRSDAASLYNMLRAEGYDIHLGQENTAYTYQNGRLKT